MANVTVRNLALAIQAVDCKMADLERMTDSQQPDQGAELEALLLSYYNAAALRCAPRSPN